MLTVSEIREKISPICSRYGIEKAYLFGSYARDEATESSDIDLRIEKGRIKNLFDLIGFWQDIKDALKKDVDIISRQPDSDRFQENLKREEILLYALQSKTARSWST